MTNEILETFNKKLNNIEKRLDTLEEAWTEFFYEASKATLKELENSLEFAEKSKLELSTESNDTNVPLIAMDKAIVDLKSNIKEMKLVVNDYESN